MASFCRLCSGSRYPAKESYHRCRYDKSFELSFSNIRLQVTQQLLREVYISALVSTAVYHLRVVTIICRMHSICRDQYLMKSLHMT